MSLNSVLIRHDLRQEALAGPEARLDYLESELLLSLANAPNHLPKMQNHVALIGFLRTITLISVTFFWIAVLHVFKGTFSCGQSIVILVLSAVISFIFSIGFVKFYRRFSLESLMAFAVTYGKQEHKHEAE